MNVRCLLTICDVSHCNNLQQDLQKLCEWSKVSGLTFNTAKCNVMTYARKRDVRMFEYTIDGWVVPRTDVTKDLGIIFDSELKFNRHIELIEGNALSKMGYVLRLSKDFRQNIT